MKKNSSFNFLAVNGLISFGEYNKESQFKK